MSQSAKKKGASRTWEDLAPELSEWILEAVASMGFSRMTPVQASTMPLFIGNKDVVVEAVTGSGKTLAFLIPVIERLLRRDDPNKRHHVGAIIVSPTRELAQQIHTVLNSLLAFHPPSASVLNPPDEEDEDAPDTEPRPSPSLAPKVVSQLLLGGTTSPAQDLSTFLKTSPNVVIATPGRLVELLRSQHVQVTSSFFEVLVLDEADRLLDLGFSDDLSKILSHLPKQRRTGLFSASVSEAVDQLIRVGLRNPVRISVKVKNGAVDQRTPASLTMAYAITPAHRKLPTLVKLLQSVRPLPMKTIVYVSTCAAVDYFQHILPAIVDSEMNVKVVPLHGKHPPNVRQKNFNRFVNSTGATVLLTTDVAARGLDIPAVDLVVQLDPPSDPKVFLHRCGRAGRAGRRGLAVVMLTPGREEEYIPFLSIRKTPVVPLAETSALQSGTTGTVSDGEADEAVARMREVALSDRAIYDKAQRAFVSWVRAYSKHVASSIFPIKEVQWDELAKGWALLRMPRMPELKNALQWSGDTTLGLDIDWSSYVYKDKVREKWRKEEAESGTVRRQVKGRKREDETTSWSEKKESKEMREARREKKRIKREKEQESKLTADQRTEKEALDEMIKQVRKKHAMSVQTDEEFAGFDI